MKEINYKYKPKILILFLIVLFVTSCFGSIPVLKTGKAKMPQIWIDKDTGHKIVRLINSSRCYSFYFTNNPFFSNEMLFVNYVKDKPSLCSVNLKTLKTRCIVQGQVSEVFCRANLNLYLHIKDSIFSVNVKTKNRKLVACGLPRNFELQSVNSTGSYLVGFIKDPREINLAKLRKNRKLWMQASFASNLRREIYIINTKTGKGRCIYVNDKWINHIQFSPKNPNLFMFCHEGNWLKVDRIWTYDISKNIKPVLMHKRKVYREACGHEHWSPNGKFVYYDLQIPKCKPLYIGITKLKDLSEAKYILNRKTWSLHYSLSNSMSFFAGDGGQYFREGKWIFYYKIDNNILKTEKLVNMEYDNYTLEPNVQITPNNKYIIFRANFEGFDAIYAVKI